ncbi:MAG: pyridoxal-dependent decarboxylase [Thermoleophilia bacterium]
MMPADDQLTTARQRIAAAYDPALLHDAGRRLADLLAANLERAEHSAGAVLPWAEPSTAVDEARAFLRDEAGSEPETSAAGDQFAALVRVMLERGLNLHDPRYIGHQVPAPVPLAGLFDAVGSVTNQVMAVYEMGPWASAVELAMVRELGEAIGWAPDTFSGTVTHGGSLANLTALLTARNVALGESWDQGLAGGASQPAPVLLTHAEAHYSVARAAGILGLGSRQTVRVGLDTRGRMDPRRLDEELARLRAEGRPVVAVVACACATPIGAFDPLEEIAAVCRKHGVWLHADAAHGGSALLSERHRHLLAGIEHADSVVWDAHKMLFVPGLCAFVLYRDRSRVFDTFRQDAPYLFDPAAPGLADYDSGVRSVECTKRAAAFGLWGVWSLFGRQLFGDMVDVTFALGRTLHAKLTAADDFVPLHEPQCNIVVFRHVPAALGNAPRERVGDFQLELRRRIIESGEFYIVPAKHDGTGALRVAIMNPLTTPEHLDRLLDALRRHGRELLGASA